MISCPALSLCQTPDTKFVDTHAMTQLLLALLIAFSTSLSTSSSPSTTGGSLHATRISLTTALNRLSVKPEHLTGYTRAQFGDWIDADGDGFDTRAEVLMDESKVKVTAYYHTIRTGEWLSLYDHVTWTNASDVDIDHVVALSEAWKSGAYAWTASRRRAYANDITVSWALRAVTDNVNMSKGDKDPSSWLPSYRSAICTFLVDWVAVKLRWGLSVDSTEKGSITRSWRSAECSGRSHPPTIDVRIAP